MQKLKENKIIGFFWKFIKIIVTIFILAVIGIIVTQRVFNNNVSIFGYRIFTVATGSMEPEYKVLDILFVKSTKPSDINIGDDLVYLGKTGDFNGKIITHRVIEKNISNEEILFTTKGIANTGEDPLVSSNDELYGIVVYRGVALSFINKTINNPIGFYVLIVIPIAILIVLEIIDRRNEKEEEEEIEVIE